MTVFWAWVSAGCLAAAVCGFSATRFSVRRMRGAAHDRGVPRGGLHANHRRGRWSSSRARQ